ncbi:MAG: twin-arginine translocation signal domain-containing protein [Cyclobacteriaceae bacterium]
MIIHRRKFIKTSAIAGIGLGLSGSVFPGFSKNAIKEGGKIGIIGLDTSHVVAFTKTINENQDKSEFEGFQVVAAYPTKGSADMPSSIDRLDGFTERLSGMGIEIVNSVEELLEIVDVILLESVDGRRHLEEALPVFKSGKRMFIDKPISNTMEGAIAIFELSKQYNVPVFSCSTTRFAPATLEIKNGKEGLGDILGANTFGPAGGAIGHLDMAFYGIHGIEALFTLMGPGCKEVIRLDRPSGDMVVGTWNDGRIGMFNAIPDGGKGGFGATVFGVDGVEEKVKILAGYDPLLVEIVEYFRTGVLPLDPADTLELFAFMAAADESKAKGGKSVTLESVMDKAQPKARKLLKA